MPEKVYIHEIMKQDEKKLVLLSSDTLYQGGGGQPPDRGKLMQGLICADIGKPVLLPQGVGWEIPDSSPFQVGEAELMVDKLYRLEISQQHSAQHIFSGWAEKLFKWKSDGFSIQDRLSKIELLEASDDPACFKEIEKRTQETILDDLPVKVIETTEEQPLRKPVHQEIVRIVEIPGVDKCGCGGTHVVSTGQVGGFSILQIERKNKNSVRVWFAAGLRLGYLAKSYVEWEQKLKKWLSGDVEERIQSLLVEADKHYKTEKWFWKQLAELIPSEEKVVTFTDLPVSLPALKILASLLAQKGISSFLVNQEAYFVLGGNEAEERFLELKKKGATGGGKGIITGKFH